MKYVSRILFIFVLTVSSIFGIQFPEGQRVWTNAAFDEGLSNTILSKLDQLDASLNDNFVGTFTLLDSILQSSCTLESVSEELLSIVEQINIDPLYLSKLDVIESQLNVLEQTVGTIDYKSSLTLLATSQELICSSVDAINQEVATSVSAVDAIDQNAIDQEVIILSKLDVLDNNVKTINSLLNLNGLMDLNSLLEDIEVCLNTVDSKVNVLETEIDTGFAGTFTLLDVNLEKSVAIASLVDEISSSLVGDLVGTYTSLAALDSKVDIVSSLVDIVGLQRIAIASDLDMLISNVDQAALNVCTLESKLVAVTCPQCLNLIEDAYQQLLVDCSLLDGLPTQSIASKLPSVESKFDILNTVLAEQNSELEIISSEMDIIESNVCALSAFDVPLLSKLELIDNELDSILQKNSTITSYLDVALPSFLALSYLELVESKLDGLVPLVFTIASNADELDGNLSAIEQKLQTISSVTESSIDDLITLQSNVDVLTSSIDTVSSTSLSSKLDRTEMLACTVESKFDEINSSIQDDIVGVNQLIQSYSTVASTYEVVESKLCIDESNLEVISSLLDQVEANDFSGVYTLIDTIESKAIVIENKIDNLINITDFSGVFTVLNAIESKVCFIEEDLLPTITTSVERIADALGMPIYSVDLPLTINSAGRYYFAEDLSTNAGDAITINTSNVYLDFNQYSLSSSNGQGVVIQNGFNNIALVNGLIAQTLSNGIYVGIGCRNIVIRDIQIAQTTTGHGIELQSTIDVLVDNVEVLNAGASGVNLQNGENISIRSSRFANNTQDGISCGNNLKNACFEDIALAANMAHGVDCSTVTNLVFESMKALSNIGNGINLLDLCNDIIVQDCIMQWNNIGVNLGNNTAMQNLLLNNNISDSMSAGIQVSGSNNVALYNNMSQNGMLNVDEQMGVNTYLGNFTFDCNGNNFSTAGSNLVGKNTEITQVTPFASIPTKWNNIDMAVGPSGSSLVDRLLSKACDLESAVDVTYSYADEVVLKICMMQSDIDLSASLVDNTTGNVDLSQLDAATTSLRIDAQALEAQILATITTLSDVNPCVSIPIDPSGTPFTAITISSEGNYYLTQGGSQRIIIAASNVSLDMRGHSLFGDGTNNGITINNGLNTVSVFNGALVGWNRGVTLNNGTYHAFNDLLCRDSAETNFYIGGGQDISLTNIKAIGSQSLENIRIQGGDQVLLDYCIAAAGAGGGIYVQNVGQIVVQNCIASGNTGDGFRANSTTLYAYYAFNNCKATANTTGFNVTGASSFRVVDIVDCISLQNGTGINISQPGVTVKRCIASTNSSNGILLTGSANDCAILDNVMLRNGTINYQDNSGNTSSVLGNFAYQITTPANNYTVSAGTLPIVNATIAAPFATRPTKWHNVSMID